MSKRVEVFKWSLILVLWLLSMPLKMAACFGNINSPEIYFIMWDAVAKYRNDDRLIHYFFFRVSFFFSCFSNYVSFRYNALKIYTITHRNIARIFQFEWTDSPTLHHHHHQQQQQNFELECSELTLILLNLI